MRQKILFPIVLITIFCSYCSAQIITPVKWSSSLKIDEKSKRGEIRFTATIDDGWHLYSTDLPAGGPVATQVEWKELSGVNLIGGITSNVPAHQQYDANFDMTLSWWTSAVTLLQKFEVIDANYKINGQVRYMSCNDQTCSSPSSEPFSFNGTLSSEVKNDEPIKEETAESEVKSSDTIQLNYYATTNSDKLWKPVKTDNGVNTNTGTKGLWLLFWTCFAGGLVALLTPCVWPIIPMTVSFFLKKSGSRSRSIQNAIIYGISIIVIYVSMGLIVTAVFGPSTLNAIATNAICNIIFFLLLVVFAISFFGAFDLHLPGSWSTKLDNASRGTTGLLSLFFMAFTLVIVSFSCTGPIIGTLLVEAAGHGNRMAPAIGMLGFALALAIPFSLFALFPEWLKKMPKGGGWLNTVKVVLGFIELALSLKFLSVADLAYGWHILDREVFLSLWIVIFGLLGLYLLNTFKLKSDAKNDQKGIGVIRLSLAIISLAFAIYLVPGLWGAPLRATSAFVPPISTQDFNLEEKGLIAYDDYEQAMLAAQAAGKPVFVDFSGYGCVNCRKMDGVVLERDEVRSFINDNFIRVTLMVDDKALLPKPIYVMENGKQVELNTIGDKWSYLQRHKFNANSQPYYVILNPNGELLSGPAVYNEDVDVFMDFLKKGL